MESMSINARPATNNVVRRSLLWDGDFVAIPVPERAKLLSFAQGKERFAYLAFRLRIAGNGFINVHVTPASRALAGERVKGWLSIWEKELDDGRVYRYIDIEPAIGDDLREPVQRWFRVIPNHPSEIEIREGWVFHNIPHPTNRGETLRGAILLYPPGQEVRFLAVPAEQPMTANPAPSIVEAAPEVAPGNLPQPTPEVAPAPEPARRSKGADKPQSKPRGAARVPKAMEAVDPVMLKKLAEAGFGLRPHGDATTVF